MDLSKVPYEDFRRVQTNIRDYVENELKGFAGIRLSNIERLSINETTRHLLENYIGDFQDFSYDNEENSEKWVKFVKTFDVYRDAFALFLLNYGIDYKSYLSSKYNEDFKEFFRRRRNESLLL